MQGSFRSLVSPAVSVALPSSSARQGENNEPSRRNSTSSTSCFASFLRPNFVRADEPGINSANVDGVQVYWPDYRRYSVRDTKGIEYGARPGNLASLGLDEDDGENLARHDSTQLKTLKRFAKGVHIAQVSANRPTEDRYSVAEFEATVKDGSQGSCLLASVFDGHGGWQIAHYLSKEVKEFFQDKYCPKSGVESVKKAITFAYEASEENLWRWCEPVASIGFSGVVKVGSCGVSAIVVKESDEAKASHVVVANVGDCRCILGRGKKTVALTTIHNANDPAERTKLREKFPNDPDIVQCQAGWKNKRTGQQLTGRNPSGDMNDWVTAEFSCYIKGCLQPSRTFGDFYMKNAAVSYDKELHTPFFQHTPDRTSFPFVTAEPELQVIQVTPKDDFLVLASDGLWDFLKDEEVTEYLQPYIANHDTKTNLAQVLLDKVLERVAKEARLSTSQLKQLPSGNVRRRLHDDTTILVIRL